MTFTLALVRRTLMRSSSFASPGLCLLTLALLASLTAAADQSRGPMPYPPLPEGISSFGATVSDGYVYVFGGHVGRIPGSSLDGLSPHFCRLSLQTPQAKWEDLKMHHSSQSPGLVAWNGNLYRVGGLSFRNKLGEETKFHSLDVFAKYDPKSNTWTDLPSLPEPRSSLDAAVVDGRIYAVGGWNLQEGSAQDAPWHDDALVFDLSKEDGAWTPIAKPPFSTRALAAVGHQGKLYVLGGMQSTNQVTRDVHVYDPKTDKWSPGPELAGGEQLSGFAISAFVADDKLYYSGSEGIVYRLSDDGAKWQSVERLLFPRSFHRLVADGNQVIAIAGVARGGGGYLANLEVVNAVEKPAKDKLIEWSIEFGGTVKQGQALLTNGASLYAFGGNNSTAPHDFGKENFVDEAYRFDLAARSVEKLAPLPRPTQGGVPYLVGSRIDQSIYVLGGLGFSEDKFSSLDTIFRYRIRSKAWEEEIGHLPTTRAMFSAAPYKGDLWLFGGSRVNTDDAGLAAETWQWNHENPAASVVAGAAIPTPRRSFGGTVLGERFYAVGGLGPDSKIAASATAFDFATQKWSDIASPQVARVFPSLAAAGGKLYLAGGFQHVDGHFQPARSMEVYDPKTNTWQLAYESLPFASRAGAMLEFQDRLLFYGIDREAKGQAHFVLLDPAPSSISFGQQPGRDERDAGGDLLARLLRLDKNKDGKLAADEVGERFRPIIRRADANKDGFATKEELEAVTKRDEPARGGRN